MTGLAPCHSRGLRLLRTAILGAGLLGASPVLAGAHLLLERNTDVAGQTDLFLISYANQADFLTNTVASQTALPQPVNAAFSAGGLHFDVPPAPPPHAVSEPGALPLLVLALAMLGTLGGLFRRPIAARRRG